MATNVSKTYFLRNLNKRYFASAAVKYSPSNSNDVKVSNLSNNTIVASTDSALPLSRLSVVIKAGSRYDPIDSPGLNHILRSSAGLTTTESTKFGIIRNIQQIGANISCTGTRDTITYTLEAASDKLDKGLKFLKDVVVNQAFKPWELEDNTPRIKFEIASIPPEARLVDLLHQAAYRTGLGNSLYVDDFKIGKISSETLQHHVACLFTSSRTAVIGVGVPHDTVSSFASDLELNNCQSPSDKATYRGGDSKQGAPGNLAYIGVVSEAAGLNSKDFLSFAVLKYALGGWSTIKYSYGNSPLAEVAKKSHEPVAVSAFNAVHSDSGLFGVIVATSPHNAKAAAQEAVDVVFKGKLTDSLVEGAKNQLIRDIADQSSEDIASDIGNQLLHIDGPYKSSEAVISSVSEVSTSSVSQALSKFMSGKKTVASYGNLGEVPFADDFKC